MKFVCIDCEEMFDHPKSVKIRVDDQFGGHPEWIETCPFCGSEDWDKVAECEVCGNPIPERLMSPDGRCPQCVRKNLMEVNYDTIRN